MTMQRMKIEKLKRKSSGKTPCLKEPYQAPGNPAEERAARVGPGLRPHERDPHRGGGDLVLTDRDPGAAQARVPQAEAAEDRDQSPIADQ